MTPGAGDSARASEFRLDIDSAEEAIRALEDVRQQIEEARVQAVKLAKTPQSAWDAVSVEAFQLLAQKADGGPGSFSAAMEAGLIHVDELIDQMQADIDRRRELDDAANALTDRA